MDTKTQAIINELAGQRNQLADTVAVLVGDLAVRDARIAELEIENKDLKQRLAPADQ